MFQGNLSTKQRPAESEEARTKRELIYARYELEKVWNETLYRRAYDAIRVGETKRFRLFSTYNAISFFEAKKYESEKPYSRTAAAYNIFQKGGLRTLMDWVINVIPRTPENQQKAQKAFIEVFQYLYDEACRRSGIFASSRFYQEFAGKNLEEKIAFLKEMGHGNSSRRAANVLRALDPDGALINSICESPSKRRSI